MNIEFEKEFGKKLSIIPLIDMPTIYCENSVRKDWNVVCSNSGDEEIYVIGNPPYKGSKKQTPSMKADFEYYFNSEEYSKNLDYIALWFIKGARYISNTQAKLAFVSTNSICQGEHVGIMFPKIYDEGVDIEFAYASFKWQNNAKDNAGVTVVIIALANKNTDKKRLFTSNLAEKVNNINAYLSPSAHNTIVVKKSKPISDFPEMSFGNMPIDDGNLTLDEEQKLEIEEQGGSKYIKKFIGAAEFIRGNNRYCLWIKDSDTQAVTAIPKIQERLLHVKESRRNSKRKETNKLAATPWRFGFISHKNTNSIIAPRVSSERREYIPMGFLDKDTIISDAANAVYDAEPWLFAILESKTHMAWVRTVCGKLKTDYRYSSTLGYNTFPCPPLTEAQKEKLNQSARNILFARVNHPELTLADMYDPESSL